jgi:two-component system, cell cycle sensor histidine kinase DivJ
MTAGGETIRRSARGGANWHLAWAVALGLAAFAWPFFDDAPIAPALAAAAVPGVVGQLLRLGPNGTVKLLVALSWPIGVGAAIALTGGASGPLIVLALAPASAMAAMDGRRLLALGVALTVATATGIVLATTAGLIQPPPTVGPWLPLGAVSVCAVGLAAALQLSRARTMERETDQAREVERLRAMLETGPLLLLRVDAEGVVREVFAGAPDDWDGKLLGQRFATLAGESHRWAANTALNIARASGQASVGFAPPLAPDRFLAVELRGLPDGDVAALVRDASRERTYEASLEQATADAHNVALAKSRFLANMSHELRTPLNAIIGFSDIMRSKMFGPLAERYAEYAALIHESGGHLLDLINDVLDMSKIEAERFQLSLEPFDAREAVSAALRLTRVQADTARISLRGALPPEPIEVNADRRAIKQIVLNLVSNALKFTPAGGEVNVLARIKGRDLEIIVADTGVGIAPADLARLGKPYEQAGDAAQRSMGTGLGLSLVRAFAELHGGTMTIKSILGEGTAVSVRLPVVDFDAMKTPPPPPVRPLAAAAGGRGDNVVVFKPQR